MNVTKLTEHQIRNWPAEEVKVFVDSGEYDPWDLSPLKIEKKPLDIADYSSICGRYVVKRFRTIDNLIEFMHEEQDSSELRLEQLKARNIVQFVVEARNEEFAAGKYIRKRNLNSVKSTRKSWEIKYGVHVNFVDNRQLAEEETKRFFYLCNLKSLREMAVSFPILQKHF